MQNNVTFFHRQFTLESFKKFLGHDTFGKLLPFLGPKRRKRLLGLEGFIWLGLFVAAHAHEPSLKQIFLLAQNLGTAAISAAFVSVSAFSQYRSFFPSKGSYETLAHVKQPGLWSPSSCTGAMARASGLCHRLYSAYLA